MKNASPITKRDRIKTQVHHLLDDFYKKRVDNLIDKIFDSGGINFEELDLNITQYRTAKTITCTLAKVLHDDYYHFSVEDEIVNLYNLI